MNQILSDMPSNLRFSVSESPRAAGIAECDLFHDPRFFLLHASAAGREGRYLCVHDVTSGKLLATGYAIELSPGCWESPGKGTFGGIQWFTRPHANQLYEAYAALENTLTKAGASSLHIILPPSDYDIVQDSLTRIVLAERRYSRTCEDLNFSVPVDCDTLLSRMKGNKRAKLRSARSNGVVAHTLSSGERAAGYHLVCQYKERRGLPMRMTEDALTIMDKQIPGSLLWTGAFRGDDMVGASITIRISAHVFYIAHIADRAGTGLNGVQELLIDEAYAEAYRRGCRLLDFGISTERGVPNDGLIRFKRECGFSSASRVTFMKVW